MTPRKLARAVTNYMHRNGKTSYEAARKFGVTEAFVEEVRDQYPEERRFALLAVKEERAA